MPSLSLHFFSFPFLGTDAKGLCMLAKGKHSPREAHSPLAFQVDFRLPFSPILVICVGVRGEVKPPFSGVSETRACGWGRALECEPGSSVVHLWFLPWLTVEFSSNLIHFSKQQFPCL